jgi:hypothetical protein
MKLRAQLDSIYSILWRISGFLQGMKNFNEKARLSPTENAN